MPVIKRYANRKLYDTEKNRYINLETIAEMIRDGEDVQVVDNVTGEDLTTITLTQIIMEKEKKQGEFLPRSVLAALIEAGGESVSIIRQKLSSPLDLLHQVDEEISSRIENLVQRGEMGEDAGSKLRNQLIEHTRVLGIGAWITEKDLEESISRLGIPSRDEFQHLFEVVNQLSSKLDEMLTEQTG